MNQDQGKHQSLQLYIQCLLCVGGIYVPVGLCSSPQSSCVYRIYSFQADPTPCLQLLSPDVLWYWYLQHSGVSPLQLRLHIQSFMTRPFRAPVQTIPLCYTSLSPKAFWNRAISRHEPITFCISETPEQNRLHCQIPLPAQDVVWTPNTSTIIVSMCLDGCTKKTISLGDWF